MRLFLVALAAFLPSLGGAFQFDDYNVIVHYPPVHSWAGLAGDLGFRPLLKASYALSWSLGLGAAGFLALNVAVHALNAVLVYALGRALCERWAVAPGAALAAALVFALHPVQVEAVSYVSGRSSSLMACFYLGALLAYVRGAPAAVSALLFAAALATKETAVTLPAALLLVELCRRERPSWRAIVRRQAAHWALLGVALVLLAASPRAAALLAFAFEQRSLAEQLPTQAGGVAYLAGRLLGLQGASIDPALPVAAGWNAVPAVQAALLAALAALALAQLRPRPWLAFGVLWFFLQLAPTNSLVPRLDVANDRQLYLAGWGLVLALAAQLAAAKLSRRAGAVAAGTVLAALTAASVARQLEFRGEIALWAAEARRVPWNARAHNNLGYAYRAAGRLDEARGAFETALRFDPAFDKARFNLLLLPPACHGSSPPPASSPCSR